MRTSNALVVSLGAELTPESIPRLSSAGHNLYPLAGATAIRDALGGFAEDGLWS